MKHNTQRTRKLVIKNMVCDRCVRVVGEELHALGAQVLVVRLGEAVIVQKPKPSLEDIRRTLRQSGFDLVDGRKARLIEKTKNAVIELVHRSGDESAIRHFPAFIEKAVRMDYHYLGALFSSVEDITVERYMILQKIERVKELLKYDELTLSEIAWQLGYSSVAHLSNQFKKVTGMSARTYKNTREAERLPLDRVKS